MLISGGFAFDSPVVGGYPRFCTSHSELTHRGADMLKFALATLAIVSLVSCTSSKEQMFLNMSESELAQYNASVPALRQIECVEGVRRTTVGLVRKVCTSKNRMARLASANAADPVGGLHNQAFYGNRSYFDDRSALPRVYFSPPPPGYTQPVIHVLDSHSRN